MKPRDPSVVRPRFRFLFRLAAVVVVPSLVLAAAEGALRLAGVGQPVEFWVHDDAHVVDNAAFTWPEFGPDRARAVTAVRLEDHKPPGRRRIFVLGGSAAQGDPDPTFAFSRVLEELLRVAWPARTYDVVNAGITAVDSTVVVRVARSVLDLEPDALVVYAGNNEFVGPSGLPMGEGVIRHLRGISRWLLGFRGPQALQLASAARSPIVTWSGMEDYLQYAVLPSDPRVDSMHRRFQHNLEQIVDMAERRGVPVVLCTVGVNLSDEPPFRTMGSPVELEAIRNSLDEAEALERGSGSDAALMVLDEALEERPAAADLVYARGRVLANLGRTDEAGRDFAMARDLDGLRFRASSAINRLIRETAEARSGAVLADVERAMAAASALPAPGNDLFYDHVHMNLGGNIVIARAVTSAMASAPQFAAWGPADATLTEAEIGRRLAFTGWSLREAGVAMDDRMSRAPFTAQRGHEARLEGLRADLERLENWVGPDGLTATEQVLRRHLEARPDDWIIRYALARVVGSQPARAGDAIAELERVCRERPTFFPARRLLGRFYLEAERPREALVAFETVLASTPVSVRSLTDCGIAALSGDELHPAQRWLERALRRDPDHVEALYHLALVEIGLDGTGSERALRLVDRVLELDPDHQDARRIRSALL